MNIKNEKGFVGTDITVAIILILLFMSVTSVLFFNLTKAAKGIERESKATYIATDVIEAVKLIPYSNLDLTTDLNETGQALVTKVGSSWSYTGKTETVDLGRNIELESGYTCYIKVENYVPAAHLGDEDTDFIKQVSVQVLYKLANEPQSVTLKTVVLREI